MDAASEALYKGIQPKLTNMTREKIGTLIVPRPSAEVVADILRLDDLTADCADILEELGVYNCGIPTSLLHPIVDDTRIAGPAVTILNESGQSGAWPYEFTDIFQIAQPGDVVVIGGEGYERTGSWGGTTTKMASELGLAGTVCQWPCRDREVILRHRYPVWAPGHTPLPTKRYLVTKAIMVPIEIHGVPVRPGDLVVADSGGVAVVPHEHVEALHARIQA